MNDQILELQNRYDVVICGAGLAGLCLARQLNLEHPELRVAMVDHRNGEIPDAAWKVGESTVELGSFYLAEKLQLGEYLVESHLRKRGLRFFLGDSGGALDERPEFGSSSPAPFTTYQIDRGIFERDLRARLRESGVFLMEGLRVVDVELSGTGGLHEVKCRAKDGLESVFETSWVIDATGRQRLLQRKLGLTAPTRGDRFSSAWFRLKGRLDVESLVDESKRDWHARVPREVRYLATNHFVGEGYWVWVIPLSSESTSVGIVAREDYHSLTDYGSFSKAMAWLDANEPVLAQAVASHDPLDFKIMKEYSYSSKKVFSSDRWACVGEAAVFSDPFYSTGVDFIAFTNTLTVDLIEGHAVEPLLPAEAEFYSRYVILLNNQITRFNQHGLNYFPDEVVTAARVLWDVCGAWGYMCPQFFNQVMTSVDKQAALRQVSTGSFMVLTNKMYGLLDEWVEARKQGGGRYTYGFFNYLSLPFILDYARVNLRVHSTLEDHCAQHKENMAFFERLIMAIFYLAVDDLYSGELESLESATAFNVASLSLNPDGWDLSQMIVNRQSGGDFRTIYHQIRGQLQLRDKREWQVA